MVASPTDADGVFLQHAPGGGRLSRVVDARAGAGDRGDVAVSGGGHPAEALQKVQGDAFGGQHAAGRAAPLGQRGAGGDQIAVCGEQVGLQGRVVAPCHDGQHGQAARHQLLAGDKPCRGGNRLAQHRAGHVACLAEVFGPGDLQKLFQVIQFRGLGLHAHNLTSR